MLREQLRPVSLSGRRRPASAYAAKTSMQFATDAVRQRLALLHDSGLCDDLGNLVPCRPDGGCKRGCIANFTTLRETKSAVF